MVVFYFIFFLLHRPYTNTLNKYTNDVNLLDANLDVLDESLAVESLVVACIRCTRFVLFE